MTTASGVRIGWLDLPSPVRGFVEQLLGSPVDEAVSQPGGFSPGTADRVRTAAGSRAFVKAVGSSINEHSLALLRAEIRITTMLAAAAPVVLGSYDDGEWAALVLEDVIGRQPTTPWHPAQLAATLTALADLARQPVPYAILPDAVTEFAPAFQGWSMLRAEPWPGLDPWAGEHLDQLCVLAERGVTVSAGDEIVHGDLRADNVLIRPDGSAVIVDWPWARRGAAWTDVAQLLVNVELYGGHDVEALTRERLGHVPVEDVTAFLAGLGGFFLDHARRPSPPGLPTLRAFQQAQGDVVLRWLRRRLE